MTNYEKIKHMSVDDLVDFLAKFGVRCDERQCPYYFGETFCSMSYKNCKNATIKEWLESESENKRDETTLKVYIDDAMNFFSKRFDKDF